MKDRKKKVQNRIVTGLLLLLCFAAGCFGCGNKTEEAPQGSIRVYYLGREETHLEYEYYIPEAEDAGGILSELVERLKAEPEEADHRSPLSFGTALLECRAEDGIILLTMDEHYRELKPTTEVLLRAALARTFVQVPGVEGVSMQIGTEPLTDLSGTPVGIMTADTFVDNEGTEINAYEKTTLHLFYANADGTGLVETQRTLQYNTNISMERLVVEQLIEGPIGADEYPVISPDTRIISVNLNDGTCYVNLSNEFARTVETATPEVTVYAIVNSLVELPNVYRVQLMINGESELLYREMIDLTNPFSRNLDLVE